MKPSPTIKKVCAGCGHDDSHKKCNWKGCDRKGCHRIVGESVCPCTTFKVKGSR